MSIRLGHVVFALIIASILNLVIAWLCTYYAVPGYQGAILFSADEFDKGSGLVTERDHDLAVFPWAAFGITELDCLGPWYIFESEVKMEDRPTPKECADQFDMLMARNIPDHDPLKQNGLRRQFVDIAYKRHTRIDAGWPMRSFRGFVSGGLQGPFLPRNPIPKRLPQEEIDLIKIERPINDWKMTRYIPYMPIWFGLIVNTLFYATVIVAIMWMLFAARSKMRLRHNLCPNCKYLIGVSEVCTECGTTLNRSLIERANARRPEAAR